MEVKWIWIWVLELCVGRLIKGNREHYLGPLLLKRIAFNPTFDILVSKVNIWNVNCTRSMMTSAIWNIFRVTGPLWREFTGDRWIRLTKASGAELWCFLLSVPDRTVEWTIETPVIWDAMHPLWRHCNATAFIFHLRTDDLEKMSKILRPKMSRLLHPL